MRVGRRRCGARLRGATALLALIVLTISACGSSSPAPASTSPSVSSSTQSAPSTPSTTSPSPRPSIDPQAQPAVHAYLAFDATTNEAQRQPFGTAHPPSSKTDFTRYSFDPAETTMLQFVGSLAAAGEAYRGTPPTPRISVTAIDLTAKPYPKVTLTDCPTLAPTWHAYVVKTGQRVPDAKHKVPPPNPITVEVIHYQRHWGVSKVTPEERTCAR